MPIQSNPDHQKRFVHTLCTEIVTLNEMRHYLQTAWQDSAIYGYSELIDYTAADLSQIDYSGLMLVAAESTKMYTLDPDSRCAILISSDEHKKMADFYISAKSLIATPTRDIKSFTSRNEAMNWLAEKRSS